MLRLYAIARGGGPGFPAFRFLAQLFAFNRFGQLVDVFAQAGAIAVGVGCHYAKAVDIHTQPIAIVGAGIVNLHFVEKGAIGRAQVPDAQVIAFYADFRVTAREVSTGNHYIALVAAANNQAFFGENDKLLAR